MKYVTTMLLGNKILIDRIHATNHLHNWRAILASHAHRPAREAQRARAHVLAARACRRATRV